MIQALQRMPPAQRSMALKRIQSNPQARAALQNQVRAYQSRGTGIIGGHAGTDLPSASSGAQNGLSSSNGASVVSGSGSAIQGGGFVSDKEQYALGPMPKDASATTTMGSMFQDRGSNPVDFSDPFRGDGPQDNPNAGTGSNAQNSAMLQAIAGMAGSVAGLPIGLAKQAGSLFGLNTSKVPSTSPMGIGKNLAVASGIMGDGTAGQGFSAPRSGSAFSFGGSGQSVGESMGASGGSGMTLGGGGGAFGDSGSRSGGGFWGGASGGGGGGSAHMDMNVDEKANGGFIPKDPQDPKGIKDLVPAKVGRQPIRLAGGEYIISKDVVDQIGPEFFDALQQHLHTPASQQRKGKRK